MNKTKFSIREGN